MNINHPSFDPLMTVEEARAYLGLGHPETVRVLARRQKIACVREPGSRTAMRFRLSELNRYVASCEGRAAQSGAGKCGAVASGAGQ